MMVLIEPPAQYDHPYPGQVVEQRLSLLQMIQLCHGPAASCAWVSKGVCYIALPQNEKDGRLNRSDAPARDGALQRLARIPSRWPAG